MRVCEAPTQLFHLCIAPVGREQIMMTPADPRPTFEAIRLLHCLAALLSARPE